MRPDEEGLIGHKAASLARLVREGYRVPPGLALTSELLHQVPQAAWEGPLTEALATLPPPWVVRSSSDAEDQAGMACAGLFKTVLGLSTPRGVFQALQEVLNSLSSESVTTYAHYHKKNAHAFRMAVVIQHLLSPESSGVAFSQHPMGPRNVVAIEATFGLGAPLVDGTITPDLISVDADGHAAFMRVGSKKQRAVFDGREVRLEDVDPERAARPALTLREARSIATLTRRLEQTWGAPQDIEWAFENRELYVLQSRPITTLPPL